jgi:hypothetical protein
MYRFVVHETDQELRPTGSLELVHEQPVYGTIKDIKALQCTFEPEDDERQGIDMDVDHAVDKPRLGYVPRKASSTVLVATSDSGVLSFLTFYCNEGEDGTPGHGQFYILKEVCHVRCHPYTVHCRSSKHQLITCTEQMTRSWRLRSQGLDTCKQEQRLLLTQRKIDLNTYNDGLHATILRWYTHFWPP